MGNHHSTPIAIEPAKFYDAAFLADLFGYHVTTVYQSMAGIKRTPLPRVTKFGRTVRFFGQHIIDFCREHGCELPDTARAPVAQAQLAAAKRPGRPRKTGRTGMAGGAA